MTSTSPLLELYYFESCPYCQRVIQVIEKLKIKVSYIDIYESTSAMEKLLYVTGRKTVPCLFIDGNPMHESLEIIKWLENNKMTLEKNNHGN